MQSSRLTISGKNLSIIGFFPRIARLQSEYHDYLENPDDFLVDLQQNPIRADLFSFLPPLSENCLRKDLAFSWDKIALLEIDTYEKWWKKQVNDKTRNMVRKPGKKGVTIEQTKFDDELCRGIHAIYNESPLIQGKPSKHYGKDFETLKKAHATFLDQSLFIAAYYEDAVIGFIKMILHPNGKSASIMQIISLVAHRDKSPTNGLLGKAVEICAERRIQYLQYGIWSRRSLGDFKKHHGFKAVDHPRYFVPLTSRGRLALALNFHRNLNEFVPGNLQDAFASLRSKWYLFRYKSQIQSTGL
jgi:hypothetical protein